MIALLARPATQRTTLLLMLCLFSLDMATRPTSTMRAGESEAAAEKAAEKAAKPAKVQLPEVSLPLAAGGEQRLTALSGRTATVLVFLSTECPISNAYVPTLNQLAKHYADQGLQVIGLNSNAGQSLKQIQSHALDYQIAFPVVKDAGGRLARLCGATTCPESLLLDAQGRVVYRGRVDDRFVRRGGAAGKVGREDLAEAVRELLAGRAVATPLTEILGCPIDLPNDARSSVTQGEPQWTFHRDIERLLQNHCQECHRPGGIGPFSLTTYDEAVRWADDIRAFTQSGQMPPWKAAADFGEFAHPRRMAKEEIEKIADWVEAGCPQGKTDDAPPRRAFRDGWKLGREPDVVLEIPEYQLGAEGPDEYRCFILPTEFGEDRYVTAMEVLPGNARVVHHVIAFLDTSGRARQLDDRDEGPGYLTSAGFPGFFPAGGLGGWAPGNQPSELPSGMARVLPKRADVVLQVHYHRSGKPETDRTRIGLYFSRTPVDRAVRNLPVLPLGGPLGDLRIPANNARYEVKTTFVLPHDVLAIAVTPHMHLLGKDMQLQARLPDGTTRPLVRVVDWDFNWQETYAFREPIALPRGTRLELQAHFDNSASNPYNPHRPPTDVLWGESTDEEMCIAFLEVVPQRRAASPDELRPPTREEQLRLLFESRMLDSEASRVETFLLWTRFLQRMTNLERNGGLLKPNSR
ncbi:MAG: redoxin domain-containing protein [Pirellulales bacterium]